MDTQLIEKFIAQHTLSIDEYEELIAMHTEPTAVEMLRTEAVKLRKQYYGDKVYTRGLIEFTNICKNDCYYCGIRNGNKNIERYRLTKEEILECCREGYGLGFRTFVLQGGEDVYYTDELMADIIGTIKESFSDCAITISIGEKSYESYKLFKEAGADRYLLRHETADEEHYKKLHPDSMSLKNRKECLYNLKKLGYQVGAGFMVGSPFQTTHSLACDMSFIQELEPEMVGIGPFIPHHNTKFKDEPAGSVELTLYLLSILRIMHPWVLLPATTALGTLAADGRERGLLAGANVVMPNLSPVGNRKKYELYDHKICTGEESAQCIKCLENRVSCTGYRIVSEQGNCIR